tara:strand:- start:15655 stop:17085 length:1431 start_codon:yes stop_codon:yes gene_type:complete
MSLKIAIAHYHLQTAGVTRVIENAVLALESAGVSVVVLTGKPYERGIIKNTVLVPELAYGANTNPQVLAAALRQSAKKALGHLPDVWHFHNHSLGKNAAFAEAIASLAKDKTPILLQIHDFAEDGRPANYRFLKRSLPVLYPQADHIHYAVLNGRDYQFLHFAGIPKERLYRIPNAVVLPEASKEIDTPALLKQLNAESLTLYPTRGIRRKNLGEFFLWALLGQTGEHFATTLTPENEIEKTFHETWVQYAKEKSLPITLDICTKHQLSFLESVQAANLTLTTSIAEGFGLAFLEPWLLGKPLSGRNLPEITADFSIDEVHLEDLYDRLNVPLDLIGEEPLKAKLQTALEAYYRSYAEALPEDACEIAFKAIVQENCLDFGRLDEALQRTVLDQLQDSPELKSGITPNTLNKATPQAIKTNQAAIQKYFSLSAYSQHLQEIYQELAAAKPSTVTFLPPEAVLNQFLDPRRFCLLRS